MSLRLSDIVLLQEFTMNYCGLLPGEKAVGIGNIMKDLTFVDQQAKIYDLQPIDAGQQPPQKREVYFFLWRQREIQVASRQDVIANFSEDHHDRLLCKNI